MSNTLPLTASRGVDEAAVFALDRPHPKLWTYYWLTCLPLLVIPPAALLVGLVNWFRYHTMRYRFDSEGINMRWGILFRREVILNYARIQDIHLVSNLVERWLGLARIQIQTASGSALPEMTIEGILEFEHLRDFLYARMRGTRENRSPIGSRSPTSLHGSGKLGSAELHPQDPELVQVLREITAEVRGLRTDLAAGSNSRKLP